jgi:hypothetical protein
MEYAAVLEIAQPTPHTVSKSGFFQNALENVLIVTNDTAYGRRLGGDTRVSKHDGMRPGPSQAWCADS